MLVRRWLWLSALLSLSISVGGLALANENKGGYRVIEVKGQVRVKSPSGSNYRPLATGGIVRQGDIVYPAEAARVTVLCEGSRIWKVPPGVPSGVNSGCPVTSLIRTRGPMTVNDLNYTLYKNMGWLQLEQNQLASAKVNLQLAIDLAPEQAAAQCLMAQVLDKQKLSQQALPHWEQCLAYASGLQPEEANWIRLARERLK